MPCPDANELTAYVARGLPAEAALKVEAHLGECPDCRAAVLAAARLEGSATQVGPRGRPPLGVPPPSLPRGKSLGRYIILDLIGQGGMGSVYAAFDPELDRRVAIKVIKPAPGVDGAAAQARLAREARTMARLAHPNVVAVHDVGTVGDELFVAMELVEGGTLGEWLRAAKRPWREVLAMFTAAGRGLAAAHEAGLVHRDFKPDNVLIGGDGRPRVGDFGLARAADVPLGPDTPATTTQTVGLMGTPAYMSPEQLRMQAAGPLSDQFSFCAALFEGLFGRRPYAGDNVADLLAAIEAARLVDARAEGVPASVQRAILRGLRARPEDRHPSMRALVDALDLGPPGRWRIAALLSVGAVAVTTVLVLARAPENGPSCDGAARLAAVWNPERRAAVADRFAASGRPYAAEVTASVQRTLEARTGEWAAMYRDACEASRRGEQSAELLDRRMGCLDDARGRLAGLIELFAGAPADDALLARAASAAAGLPGVERCADRDALLAVIAPPASPAAREQAARVRERLGDARARLLAHRLTEARTLAAALSVEATLAGSPQLEADTADVLAQIDLELGSSDAAEAGFRRAAALAAGAHDDALLAGAVVGLIAALQRADRYAELKGMAGVAGTLVARAGDDPLLRARLMRGLATADFGHDPKESLQVAREALKLLRAAGAPPVNVFMALDTLSGAEYYAGNLADARTHVEETMATAEPILGRRHPRMAGWLNNLGVLARLQGDEKGRIDYYRRALALAEEGLGPDHVDVGEYSMNLGNAYAETHHTREARPLLERGLAIRRRVQGPEHSQVAEAMGNLASLELMEHRPEQARDLAASAVSILERTGSRTDLLGVALAVRGEAFRALGARAEALADHERAVALCEKALGPEHLITADKLVTLGTDWVTWGQPAKAMPLYQRALAIAEKDGSPNHILDRALLGLGEVALATGRAADALPVAERALAIRQTRATDASDIAEAEWLTARALWATGHDRARARALAHEAARGYGPGAPETAEVTAWLGRH